MIGVTWKYGNKIMRDGRTSSSPRYLPLSNVGGQNYLQDYKLMLECLHNIDPVMKTVMSNRHFFSKLSFCLSLKFLNFSRD